MVDLHNQWYTFLHFNEYRLNRGFISHERFSVVLMIDHAYGCVLTTEPGDIILYQGSKITIYYD